MQCLNVCYEAVLLVCYIYPFGTIYVISEGEEGIRADGHGLQGADPGLLFSR